MKFLKNASLPANLCLVCGVDSGPIRTFLFGFIGCLVGASVLVLIWGQITGRFRDSGEAASLALKAEESERPHE